MYISECTLGARCVYSGGRQCGNGGRWNIGGGVLFAAWPEATRLPVCGTATRTEEVPTVVCPILL